MRVYIEKARGLKIFGITTCFLLAAQLSDAAPAPKAKQDVPTQSIMQQIIGPLSRVLPLSFDDQSFEASKNRAAISKDLKQLMEGAAHLEDHARRKDKAFDYIAKSLRNDARHAYRRYERGDFEEAKFAVHNMTENCIACHESLPETHKVPPATGFFSALKIDSLHPLEKAHFYVVSRQFDDAMKTYEDYFTSGTVPLNSIGLLGSFTDYLKIATNAKGDLERPKKLVEKILARPDLPGHVKNQMTNWLQAIEQLESEKALTKSDIATAQKVLTQGREIMEFPRDRNGTVHYVTAAAILNRYIHDHPESTPEVAEAYYLLGTTESLLSHSYWISREEFDFETAIRLAPAAPFAEKAYTLLEESYTVGFSGSSGTHIPPDIKSLLAELRKLIDNAKTQQKS